MWPTTNRTIVIQGANGGLGQALLRRVAARKDVTHIIAMVRDPNKMEADNLYDGKHDRRLDVLEVDVEQPQSIVEAARQVGELTDRVHLLINATGVLHSEDGMAPEKKLEQLDQRFLQRGFAVNTIGPLLVAQSLFKLMAHEERAVLANISARVGSIGDNGSGGWYTYRASKAALNMLTKTMALEMKRRAPNLICVALHPGTVDTQLSQLFQSNVPAGKLFAPAQAAGYLMDLIDDLEPADSGSFLAWDGQEIPW